MPRLLIFPRPLLSASIVLAPVPLAAQAVPDEPRQGAPTANTQDGVPEGRGRSYDPAYFAQYAPRTALDMVERLPGFSISGGDGNQRGLGEANQNVLVNGERFSSKSESVRDQLRRLSAANVVRIEVVDGTTLDIPGLSGQVANVIVEQSGASGQFRWNTGFRAYNAEPQLYGGEVSLTGSSGKLGYTVSLRNNNDRFGGDGPILLTDRFGALIERQETKFSGAFDNPKLAVAFSYAFAPDITANFNLSYGEDFFFRTEPETGFPVSGPVRKRSAIVREDGPEYEIGGDIALPLGPGRLKLIALERFERDNYRNTIIDRFGGARADIGSRFTQTNGAGERIGRFEYGWRMLDADWQVSGEAAFNRLDRVSGLFSLSNGGFVAIPFPSGTGGVTEERYESILSFSRQLTDTLAFQATAGGEYSKIEQTGVAANSRSFQRPKGSVALAYKPSPGFGASVELRRSVGQLSFGDFLASVALGDNNENAGNNELVPLQAWALDAEINKALGIWGSAKLKYEKRWVEDYVEFVPLAGGLSEARGNIPRATRSAIELNATIKFDPLGWRGAQVDVEARRRWSDLIDPFTGFPRRFGRDTDVRLEADFRHDIPSTPFAYGFGANYGESTPYSRLFETGFENEGPVFLDLFIEHKDLFGMTVNARIANVLGARQDVQRVVYAGPRPDAPIAFFEDADRRIGPIFRFSVSGNF